MDYIVMVNVDLQNNNLVSLKFLDFMLTENYKDCKSFVMYLF